MNLYCNPIKYCLPGLINEGSLNPKILSHFNVMFIVCLSIVNGLTNVTFQILYGDDFSVRVSCLPLLSVVIL